MSRKQENHVAQIEAVLRGENQTGHSDRAVIMAHVREMQRQINELAERIEKAHAQLELFKEKS